MLTLTSPVDTWAHRLPAAVKLASLCAFTVLLFWLASPAAQSIALAATAALILSGGLRFATASAQLLRQLWPFVLIVTLWHAWSGDAATGVAIVLRMITAVAAANFVTMTTRLSDMIAVIETLCRPLARLGLSPRTLALAVALVIRFIPVMLERTAQISESWRARSPRRPGWRILLPATLAALDDADRVAEALRARGGTS
jgi:biotin transport system permease protein